MRNPAYFGVCCLLASILPVAPSSAEQKPASPAFRVDASGFDASAADIRAVLDSAGRELYRFFPDYKIEPIVVTRGHEGPITLYQRNDRREIVVRLDTGNTFWSQYAYQYAHELCHILCGFRPAYAGNKWFEETLCETSSLFVMRAMARTWRTSPPYSNWRNYHDSLRDYVDDIIVKRLTVHEIYTKGMSGFYLAHQAELEKNPCQRELNGAMAVILLQFFEERPERWEAVRWLNADAPKPGDTFAAYLQKWHNAAPKRCQGFIHKIAELYAVPINSTATE